MEDHKWRFFLTGGVALENPYPNPFPQWLSDKAWGEVVRASELSNLEGWKDSAYTHTHMNTPSLECYLQGLDQSGESCTTPLHRMRQGFLSPGRPS